MHMYTCFRTEALNTHHAGKESEREREIERERERRLSFGALDSNSKLSPILPTTALCTPPKVCQASSGRLPNTKEMLGPRVRLVPACGCLRRGDFGLLPDLRSLRLRRRIWSLRRKGLRADHAGERITVGFAVLWIYG